MIRQLLVATCVIAASSGLATTQWPVARSRHMDAAPPLFTEAHYYRRPKSIPILARGRKSGWIESIGYVENGDFSGTGWIVSEGGGCYALTDFHVVFDADETPSVNKTVRIGFGQGKDDSFETHVTAHPIRNGWMTLAPGQRRTAADDWIVLKMSRCVGQTFGSLTMTNSSIEDFGHQRISTAGYNGDRDYHSGISYEGQCPGLTEALVLDGTKFEGVMAHHCTTIPGASGSPIIFQGRVVGMVFGEYGLVRPMWVESVTDATRRNAAVTIKSIASLVRAAIAEDDGTAVVTASAPISRAPVSNLGARFFGTMAVIIVFTAFMLLLCA